ncbi:(2Fe-2S)-binding protein [Massilia sp. W12]|uniref:(2Fe-2S)-binding protein n=1 Tax=Massilia sp. W12 TaxID=3126507 RepID=UPI0030D22BA0
MIVCVCNNVSDREITRAVQMGMQSMADLRRNLGVGDCCGKCGSCAKRIMRDAAAACPQQRGMSLAAA